MAIVGIVRTVSGGECGADRVVLVLLDRAGSSAVVGAVVGPGWLH